MSDDKPTGAESENNSRPGRMAFVATDDQRTVVRDMALNGAILADIAVAVGISIPTLRKAFATELAEANVPQGPDLFDSVGLQPPPQPAPTPSRVARRKPAGGRPRYRRTDRDRDRVATMAAGGASVRAIAVVLKITEPTLRRYYGSELETAAEVKRAEMIEHLHDTASKGNVAAQKAYLELCDHTNMDRISKRFGTAAPPPDPRPSPMGKKEQAAADAELVAASSKWSSLIGRSGPDKIQ